MDHIRCLEPNVFLYLVILNLIVICTNSSASTYGPSAQSEAYFNGSSYIRLLSTISLKKQTGLSFRTCYGGNLISQPQNEDLIQLSVNSEGVVFLAKTAGKTYEHKVMGNFLNNRWHTVYLQYRLGNLTIQVDGEVQLIANSSYQNELLVSPGLYNEGAAVLLIGKQFSGCLLEGPSIVFDPGLIKYNYNVVFELCPIPLDNCEPREKTLNHDFCNNEPCMRHGTCLNGQQTYTCACLPRYTGKNCEIDLGNPCDRKPSVCKNSATCLLDSVGDYSCLCAPGFTGRFCEHEVKVHPRCKNSPCLNGGTCEYVHETDRVQCRCKAGYGGQNCEVNVDECASGPCFNGGSCADGYNNFTCDCSHTGYRGRLCEVNINECVANPCLNQGTCFDNYGSYFCQCLPGFGGKNCQNNIDECASQPCFNNGICVGHSGSYECRCLPGFLGDHCEVEQSQQRQCDPKSCPPYADCVDDGGIPSCVCKREYPGEYPNCYADSACVNNQCQNGGICSGSKGTVNCSCPVGFTGLACETNTSLCDTFTDTCLCTETSVNCSSKPCLHARSCRDYLGGYLCTCRSGWMGKNCDMKVNRCSTEPCRNNGRCRNHGNGDFNCICAPGFKGKYCQIKMDYCASNPCLNGGACRETMNGFVCNCTEYWMGAMCEKPYEVCELNPCRNNGTCIAAPNKRDFTCQCLPGFEGEFCETNIDDCQENQCPPSQICIDGINNYECVCPPGYTGKDCMLELDPCAKKPCLNGTCVIDKVTHRFSCVCNPGYTGTLCNEDIDECQVHDDKICNQGICVNNQGSFQCYCKPGFTGERCNLDFDECLSMPCRNEATCINLINNYECHCPQGYEGKDCSLNIDECAPKPCVEGSTCVDGINEYTCVCQPGLTGKRCEINIDDCVSSPCLNGAQCNDGLNSYTCDCTDTGYEGIHCENNIDDCKGNPCLNGAECVDEVKDYKCDCYKGYTGKNCETDINECESNPCQYNGTCLEKSNVTLYDPNVASKMNIVLPESFNRPFNYSDSAGYECLCVPGVTGQNCEININECESNPCVYGTCTDKIGDYECECDEGYEGERCENDIDECLKYNPCVQGKCQDRVANYFCQCNGGYGGKNCSVELTGCMNSPCSNNGQCHPYLVDETEHRFNCSCPNGFHGHKCEQITTMSLNGSSSITINTSREEGYDIQFRFKTTLGDGLLALGKGTTFYILELSSGRLNLHSSLLNKWEGVFIGSNLNDSNWQKVFVAINSSHLVLSANDEQSIFPINYNENNNVSSTSFPLTYIGGIPSNLRKLTHGQPFLVGCIEDIVINGEWVLPEIRSAPWLSFQNVEDGCSRKPQCDPNPCHSGGHCTDRWREFSCTCERPYLGHTCQYNYTAATFGYENITDSLVTVDVDDYARKAIRSIVDISMFIRTRQSRGQIFYLGSGFVTNEADENYISAELEGGELLVRIHFSGSQEAYTVGGVKLDNGYNHLIEVIRNNTLVQVKINSTEYFRKTISSGGNLDAQVLYLGGQPQSRSVRQTSEAIKLDITPPTAPAAITAIPSNVHFKGIIQDVQISNGSFTMVAEFYPLQAPDLYIPKRFGEVTFDKMTVLQGVRSDNSCRTNPCQHGIPCENTWNDYRCICPPGLKGKTCAELQFCEIEGCPYKSECRNLEDGYECISNSTYDGIQEPLKYRFTMVSPTAMKNVVFDTMELNYRTRSWGTALFAKYKDDYFVVFIYHNEVVVEWNFNHKLVQKRFRKNRFEGQWMSLYFIFKEQRLKGGFKELVLDDFPDFEAEDFSDATFTEIIKEGNIYIAGSDGNTFDYKTIIENTDFNMTGYVPASDTTTAETVISNSLEYSSEDVLLYKVDQEKKTDNFKGCLGEIRIGGLLVPYFHTKEIFPNNTYAEELFELDNTTNATHECILCYNTDCFHDGYCINSTETYKCRCPPGYSADDCSIDINECENNQCQNNATCKDLVAKYECECSIGYEGEFCEVDIDECNSNPCKHGGTCNDLIGTFKCDCPEDFVGKQCEAPLLITCDNRPCREGSTCKTGPNEITGNNFTCLCTEGMEGSLCDTPFCLKKHCEQGHCNTTGEIPFCECKNGFDGKFCENDIDECRLDDGGSPCQNGGVCIDGIGRFDCNCTGTGYMGLLCEIDIDECESMKIDCGRAGSCENMPGSYRCICDTIKGKCGYQCDLDDPCEVEHPCDRGLCHSKCTDKPDYVCVCEEGYTGKNCTELKVLAAKEDGGFNILYIVVPVVLVIVLGLAIGLMVLVNVARSKRATRGTYSPSAQEFCNPRVELDHVLKPPPEERLI